MFAPQKISAYIILHDDYDILDGALRSIADLVDEIVVVDGAYEWLAPFFAAAGLDPSRSSSAGLDVLHSTTTAGKITYYSGVWKDELSKRSFAYSKCSHPIVYLIDADEIHLVDHHRMADFLSSGKSIGCLESPLLFSDEAMFVDTSRANPIGHKPVVFKKDAFDDVAHLSALWLVISDQERLALPNVEPSAFFPHAIGMNYHLSLFRSYQTAVNRCRFYCLRYCREFGRNSWLPGLVVRTDADLTRILDYLSPRDFDIFMWGHPITIGFQKEPGIGVARIEIAEGETRTVIGRAYRAYRESIGRLAHITPDDYRILLNGVEFHIDVTDEVRPLSDGNPTIRLEFAAPVDVLSVQSYSTRVGSQIAVSNHRVELDGRFACFDAGRDPADDRLPDRLVIGLTARWSNHDRVFVRLNRLRVSGS